MTPEDALKKLQDIEPLYSDQEAAHSLADDVFCDFLISLGYQAIVDEWKKVPKWYA